MQPDPRLMDSGFPNRTGKCSWTPGPQLLKLLRSSQVYIAQTRKSIFSHRHRNFFLTRASSSTPAIGNALVENQPDATESKSEEAIHDNSVPVFDLSDSSGLATNGVPADPRSLVSPMNVNRL